MKTKKTGCIFSILVFMFLYVVFLRVFPNCTASSKQAENARMLSQEQLADLHKAMKELRESITFEHELERHDLMEEDIPELFRALLDPKLVRPGGYWPLVRLEGCFDHHLDLMFYGIGEPNEDKVSPRIVLVSGEHDIVEEVLFEAKEIRTNQSL